MTRRRLCGRIASLLLYVIWREWICGLPSAVHPTEAAVLLLRVACGADLRGLDA